MRFDSVVNKVCGKTRKALVERRGIGGDESDGQVRGGLGEKRLNPQKRQEAKLNFMANAVVNNFIDSMQKVGHLCFIDGQKIICGGEVVVSVDPNIDAKRPTLYRLEMPKSCKVEQELPCAILFLSAVYGGAIFAVRLHAELKALFFNGSGFEEEYKDFELKAFPKGDAIIFLAKPLLNQAP